MDFLVLLHSAWRWAVLATGAIALVMALGAWLGPLEPPAARAGKWYTIALDIQVLLGLVLWIGESAYSQPGFFRFEHPGIMVIAVAVAHAGTAMARRAATPRGAARTIALAALASLLLIVLGIPGVVRR